MYFECYFLCDCDSLVRQFPCNCEDISKSGHSLTHYLNFTKRYCDSPRLGKLNYHHPAIQHRDHQATGWSRFVQHRIIPTGEGRQESDWYETMYYLGSTLPTLLVTRVEIDFNDTKNISVLNFMRFEFLAV